MSDDSGVAAADALISSQELILNSGRLNAEMEHAIRDLFARQRRQVEAVQQTSLERAIQRAFHLEEQNLRLYAELEKSHHELSMDMIDMISSDDD
jgi:hypothetical protein